MQLRSLKTSNILSRVFEDYLPGSVEFASQHFNVDLPL